MAEEFELTPQEKRWIKSLQRATKNIPPRLCLFASESGLDVLAKSDDGGMVYTKFDGVDQDSIVAHITSNCESGAW
jgi:hypothetical protein